MLRKVKRLHAVCIRGVATDSFPETTGEKRERERKITAIKVII